MEVSFFRLCLLRAMYAFIAVGFGLAILPGIIGPHQPWSLTAGVMKCMLLSFWLLSILGLRYPLRLLPVLFWEMLWKILWLSLVAWPAWRSGNMDADMQETVMECLLVVLIPLTIPWNYVFHHYLKNSTAPWRGSHLVATDTSHRSSLSREQAAPGSFGDNAP